MMSKYSNTISWRSCASCLAISTALTFAPSGLAAQPESAASANRADTAQSHDYVQLAAAPQKAIMTTQAGFEKFAPQTNTKSTRIDYEIWDEALKNVVLDLGPSIRVRAPRPQAQVGSRMVKGHKSAYRLEGSRFTFAYITDEYRAGLTEYRKDLQSLPDRVDLTSLSRDEQLAYWFNLHNVSVIEQIAIAYPTKRPADIKIKMDDRKVKLDEAKFIEVSGIKMSPRDIRTQIVYPNWSNSNVIYGFYRGDIGSPMLPRYAYEASNLNYTLNDNGYEFANSLRGFNRTLGHRNVSAVYQEAAPYYFPDWDHDLTAHLSTHIDDDKLLADLNNGEPIRIDRYDTMVADLSGGQRLGSSGAPISGQLSMSADTQRLLTEVRKKQDILRGRGVIGQQPKGWVVIEDLYAVDPDKPVEPKPETESDQ